MTTPTATDVAGIPAIDHGGWLALSEVETERLRRLVEALGEEEWSRPTDCEGWSVRDVVAHLNGSMASSASVREQIRQTRHASRERRRHGGPLIDHMTALQVRERSAASPAELTAEFAKVAPRALRGRRRVPRLVRRAVKLPVDHPVEERWPLGYLLGPILTRDQWMHRVDLCRASGRRFEADAGHDGRIVADVVREWAERHGRPFELVLAGPAGGWFTARAGDPGAGYLELDAVEFCRLMSGRPPSGAVPASELLSTVVPF